MASLHRLDHEQVMPVSGCKVLERCRLGARHVRIGELVHSPELGEAMTLMQICAMRTMGPKFSSGRHNFHKLPEPTSSVVPSSRQGLSSIVVGLRALVQDIGAVLQRRFYTTMLKKLLCFHRKAPMINIRQRILQKASLGTMAQTTSKRDQV